MSIKNLNFRLITFLLALNFLVVLLSGWTFSSLEASYPVFEDFPLPESLRLCGEPIPLENHHVREMLEREFIISVWDQAQVFLWLKRAGRYFPYIEKKLAEAGMPDDLKYLAVAESALLTHIRSKDGALGTWQLMKHTARHNDLRKDRMLDERLNFERSTAAALKHLKRLRGMFDSWTMVLAAYNCGEGRIKKEIRKQKVKDYYRLNLPLETERFIFRIAAVKIIMENPKRYGYNLAPDRIYQPAEYDTVQAKISVPIHVMDVAQALDTDFKVLKEFNPQILGDFLPAGKYMIKVPSGQGTKTATVLKKLTRTASRRMKKVSDQYYVVLSGDTLSHIAQRTGVSVDTLKRLNGIRGSLIRAGEKLRLRP
jgi:LysM repeat protein